MEISTLILIFKNEINAKKRASFEALFDENRILATKDFVQGDNGVYEDWVSSHGMFVLSTIAGILPDSAYGTATQAEFLLLRSEDTDSELRIEEHNWIAAAEYADSLRFSISLINVLKML